jgi:hypothetical protein
MEPPHGTLTSLATPALPTWMLRVPHRTWTGPGDSPTTRPSMKMRWLPNVGSVKMLPKPAAAASASVPAGVAVFVTGAAEAEADAEVATDGCAGDAALDAAEAAGENADVDARAVVETDDMGAGGGREGGAEEVDGMGETEPTADVGSTERT